MCFISFKHTKVFFQFWLYFSIYIRILLWLWYLSVHRILFIFLIISHILRYFIVFIDLLIFIIKWIICVLFLIILISGGLTHLGIILNIFLFQFLYLFIIKFGLFLHHLQFIINPISFQFKKHFIFHTTFVLTENFLKLLLLV